MALRRAPAVLGATAVGLGATLGFHAHARTPVTTAATTTASSSSSASSSGAGKSTTGQAVSTRYGPVQVRVTISGGKVTDVQAVQLPETDPKDQQISAYAAPLLRQSALSRQSANVDVVSGATYTSEGYKSALQSALDQAGFHA